MLVRLVGVLTGRGSQSQLPAGERPPPPTSESAPSMVRRPELKDRDRALLVAASRAHARLKTDRPIRRPRHSCARRDRRGPHDLSLCPGRNHPAIRGYEDAAQDSSADSGIVSPSTSRTGSSAAGGISRPWKWRSVGLPERDGVNESTFAIPVGQLRRPRPNRWPCTRQASWDCWPRWSDPRRCRERRDR